MKGKRAATNITEEFWPRPHHCPASPRVTKGMINPKALLWWAIFWDSALEYRWHMQGVILSIPGQQTRSLRHPEGRKLMSGDASNNILPTAICALMERQKPQKQHTGGTITLGLPKIKEGSICGLVTASAM